MAWYHQHSGKECVGIGCEVRLAHSQFMCRAHWRMVPEETRRALRTSKGDEYADAELDAIESTRGVES